MFRPHLLDSFDVDSIDPLVFLERHGTDYFSFGVFSEEKLFEAGPSAGVHPLGAWQDEHLVGVAAVSGNRLRLLAVVP